MSEDKDAWKPPCHWCGCMSEGEIEMEPGHTSVRNRRVVTITMAKRLPICGMCRADVRRISPGMARAIEAARARYWQRRQERLI